METTYKVRGGDGKEYGPVAVTQLQTWMREGRVAAHTQLLRSDQSAWRPASEFAELQPPSSAAPAPAGTGVAPPAGAAAPSAEQMALEARIKSGAAWFYWIAGLSLVNSFVALSGSKWGFILGLGITQVFDAIGRQMGSAGMVVALVLDLFAAVVLVLFGVFAGRKQAWSFIVGMVLYALDGLIFLLAGDWLSVGFHVFALFGIWRGFQALGQRRQFAAGLQ